MGYFEDWEVELLADWMVLEDGDEETWPRSAVDKGHVRLLAAMMLSCRGQEDCHTCLLRGRHLCFFETEEPPPAQCMAQKAA